MKRKSKLKKILISVVAVALAAAIGFGIWFAAGTGGEPVNVYAFDYIGMTEFWGDSQESYGFVRTDKVQTVFLSDTQTVTEILVAQGDTVSKGDVLMTFDTTLSDLALERKRLDVEKLKLQLEDAWDQLYEINSMKPMVIPVPDEDEETDEDLGIGLTDAYMISGQTAYDGSTVETAMICWLNSTASIDDSILDALMQKAAEYQAKNAALQPPATEPSQPATEPPSEPSAEATQSTEATDSTESTGSTEPTESTESTQPTQSPDPTEPETVSIDRFYVVFKVTEGNMSLGSRTVWQGMLVIADPAAGYRFQFFDASTLPDHMLAPDETAEEEPEIDYGSGFTSAQIAQMRSDQEKNIRDLEFSIKMAEAEYKIMQTEVSDGNVYAQVDGTVISLLSEEEAQFSGQPILKVSGGGGFYVDGTVSELDRDNMVIGSQVTINDWNTGMTYTGTVERIGDYPSSQDGWNGMGNPNATYYPFTVFIEETADLQSDSYVNILYSPATSENGVYLENPFVRTENGRSYVYVLGSDGKLEQRFVTTGKSLWGSYTEILDGITQEDFIAFPYGSNVKPGAEAVEADISALYE